MAFGNACLPGPKCDGAFLPLFISHKVDRQNLLDARFVSLRNGLLLAIHMTPENGGQLTIRVNNMEVAGEIIQDLCAFLTINELESVVDFPQEFEDFKKVEKGQGRNLRFRCTRLWFEAACTSVHTGWSLEIRLARSGGSADQKICERKPGLGDVWLRQKTGSKLISRVVSLTSRCVSDELVCHREHEAPGSHVLHQRVSLQPCLMIRKVSGCRRPPSSAA